MGITSMNKTLSFFTEVFGSRAREEDLFSNNIKPQCPNSEILNPFERATPESQGVSSDDIALFLEKVLADKTVNLHNLLIIKNKKVIFETAFGQRRTDIWKYTFSASKSIVALAVLIAIEEGKLSLETKAVDFFETVSPIIKLKLKDFTVENLLTMQSGASFNEIECMSDNDWIRAFFNSITLKSVGKVFNYNSINTYILSAIVCKVTGETLLGYLEEKLFKPLSITDVFWEKSPENIEIGGWGLYIKPEDLAKIGQMVLDGGLWNGKRIISSEMVQTATTSHAETPAAYGEFNYGYQIWCGRNTDTFLFNGMFGQNLLCFRQNGIILVSGAGNNETFQQNNYFKYAFETFNKDSENKLCENKSAQKRLVKLKQSLTAPLFPRKTLLERLLMPSTKAECEKIAGKSFSALPEQSAINILPVFFQIVSGCRLAKIQSISFEYENRALNIIFGKKDGAVKIPVGTEGLKESTICLGENKYSVATSGSFSKDEDKNTVLILKTDYLETPFSIETRFYFCGDRLIVKQTETPSSEFVLSALMVIKKTLAERPIIGSAIQKIDPDYLRYMCKKAFSPTSVFIEQ